MADSPSGKVRVKMYSVGFGDCFLVSFGYKSGNDRHVMIDCGVRGRSFKAVSKAVTQLGKDCGGKLHAMVFTHRHSDHISGLGQEAIAKALLDLKPDLIVQPWTEDPDAAPDATQPDPAYTDDDRAFVKELLAGQDLETAIAENPDDFEGYGYTEGMYNKKALEELIKLQDKSRYVAAGDNDVFDAVLPGITARVLGPPTLAQWPDLKDREETKYWEHRLGLVRVRTKPQDKKGRKDIPFEAEIMDPDLAPTPTRWFIGQVEEQEQYNVLRLVTAVNGALNNTSLVLLFEVKGKGLLFAGDAEHAAWDFILSDEANRQRLRKVRLYKVSHHGSGNGTPKADFWEKLKNRSKDADARARLVTLLSGSKSHGFDSIPASTLHDVLSAESKMMSTYAADDQEAPWVVAFP